MFLAVNQFFKIKHSKGGICDSLPENRLGIGLEGGSYFLLGGFGVHEDALDAQLFQGIGEEVDGAAVDGGGGNEAVAGLKDIQQREQRSRLTGGGTHSADAALQHVYLLLHSHNGGVLEAGVDKALGGVVEDGCHVVGGVIDVGGALDYGDYSGLGILGGIACVEALS